MQIDKEKKKITDKFLIIIQQYLGFNIGIWIPSFEFDELLDDIISNISDCIKGDERYQEIFNIFNKQTGGSWGFDDFIKLDDKEIDKLEFRIEERRRFNQYLFSCRIYYNLYQKDFQSVKEDYNSFYNILMEEGTKNIQTQNKKGTNKNPSKNVTNMKTKTVSNFLNNLMKPLGITTLFSNKGL